MFLNYWNKIFIIIYLNVINHVTVSVKPPGKFKEYRVYDVVYIQFNNKMELFKATCERTAQKILCI